MPLVHLLIVEHLPQSINLKLILREVSTKTETSELGNQCDLVGDKHAALFNRLICFFGHQCTKNMPKSSIYVMQRKANKGIQVVI